MKNENLGQSSSIDYRPHREQSRPLSEATLKELTAKDRITADDLVTVADTIMVLRSGRPEIDPATGCAVTISILEPSQGKRKDFIELASIEQPQALPQSEWT